MRKNKLILQLILFFVFFVAKGLYAQIDPNIETKFKELGEEEQEWDTGPRDMGLYKLQAYHELPPDTGYIYRYVYARGWLYKTGDTLCLRGGLGETFAFIFYYTQDSTSGKILLYDPFEEVYSVGDSLHPAQGIEINLENVKFHFSATPNIEIGDSIYGKVLADPKADKAFYVKNSNGGWDLTKEVSATKLEFIFHLEIEPRNKFLRR